MLSVLFATNACYRIKENKEKSFYPRKLPFSDINYHFATAN